MSKLELKAAMTSLQVKKPLRLEGTAPSFKPPLPPLVNLGAHSTQGLDSSQVLYSPQDVDSSMDANAPEDLSRPQDSNSTEGDASAQDDLGTLGENPSQDDSRQARRRPRSTEQGKAVSEIASVRERLSTGYTRVPNAILMQMIAGDLSRNEIKIVMLIARMTISFNRPLAPMSKNVIERMTGIQGRAVLEALQTLEKSGLVRKVGGNPKTPNRLGLVFDDPFSGTKDPKTDANRTSDENSSQDQKSTHTWGEISSSGWDSNSSNKKDSSKNKEKHLSKSAHLEEQREYFESIKAPKKRESEIGHYESLRERYSQQEIAEALAQLKQHGVPVTGTACHSPMAYLAHAIDEVLAAREFQACKARESENRKLEQHAKQAKLLEDEKRIEAELVERDRAFHEAFPTDESQSEYFEQVLRRYPMLSVNGAALKNLAMCEWWNRGKELLERFEIN